jgi:CO dehydrogenase maturation factor
MKIAITGKGGVGKTTLSSILSHLYAAEGKRVIAVDADPDANLAQALGVSPAEIEKIKPIADMADLIEERTGAKPGTIGSVFKMNPKVDDLPEEIGYKIDGITLLMMGKAKTASSGCYCPENVLLKQLLKHLVVERDEIVIADMEAGIEHMTRGTSEAVDAFIVVVEPGQRSIQTANTVKEMAKSLGVKKVFFVANKIRTDEDIEFLKRNIKDVQFLGALRFSQSLMDSDIRGISPFHGSPEAVAQVKEIKLQLDAFARK